MHSEGILSGELKHGPLALVDENMPCVLVVLKDNTYTKCHNALQQVLLEGEKRGRKLFKSFLDSDKLCCGIY